MSAHRKSTPLLVGALAALSAGPLHAAVRHWSTSGPSTTKSVTVLVHPMDPARVYAVGTREIFRSTDGGRFGFALPLPAAPTPSGVMAGVGVVLDPSDPDILWAWSGSFTTSHRLSRSTDGGDSWASVPVDLALGNGIRAFGIAATNPPTLYLARGVLCGFGVCSGGGFYKSTDGVSWTLASFDGEALEGLQFDPGAPRTLYLWRATRTQSSYGAPYRLLRSVDGGARWEELTSRADRPFDRFAFGSAGTLYGTLGSDVYQSTDQGRTFARRGGPSSAEILTIAAHPSDAATLYAGLRDRTGVARSTDGGSTWSSMSDGIASQYVGSLSIDADGRRLVAGTGALPQNPNGPDDTGAGVFRWAFEGTRSALPASASIHGANGAFFHSDVRVYNASSRLAEVTAVYRCFTGSCDGLPRRFSVGVGQQVAFDDIGRSLFGAAESAGPIELESSEAILVTSRVSSPGAPAASYGQDVPGFGPSRAFASSVLTSLSHSADSARGFRTNIGVYNASDAAETAVIRLHDPLGLALGELSRPVSAHAAAQVNDLALFAELGLKGDLAGFYATVTSAAPLVAYATVIDNRTQDPSFVRAEEDGGGVGASFVLPTAASIHGLGGAFFHSDVRVFNPSFETAAHVTATYRCSTGACGFAADPRHQFQLEPREMRTFEDMVSSSFGAPESAGGIEMDSDSSLVVTSRVYTPSSPAPTVGFHLPAAPAGEALPSSVLMALSHSADPTRGFRTNVGAFNPSSSHDAVLFTFHSDLGARLGELRRELDARRAIQVNDAEIFGELGVSADLTDLYCVVRSEAGLPLHTFATVIDNQSQDPVFVQGR